MRILVLGGTRFIGLAIVRALAAAGHDLAVFHRGQTSAELPDGVRELLGDKAQLAKHAAELRAFRPAVVVDMLAFTEADTLLTQDVFSGHTDRLALISSCDVYRAYGVLLGHDDGPQSCPIAEDAALRSRMYPFRGETPRAADDPRRSMDDYDKIIVERLALARPELPATVLRLPMVYGPGDFQLRMFPYLKRIADDRPAILLDAQDAARRFSRGYIDNVASACALAITSPQTTGSVYNVADEPCLTELEWARAIAAACGWDGRFAVLPSSALPEQLRAGPAQDLHVDTTRLRALGWHEAVELADAVARTVTWERANMPQQFDPAQFDYTAEDAALAV